MGRSLEVARQEGVLGLLRRARRRVVSADVQILLECGLDSKRAPGAVTASDGCSTRWASLDDLDRYPELELTVDRQVRQTARVRLDRGDRCAVGLSQGTPATYLWVTSHVRELPRLDLPLGGNSIFVYKTFTVPRFRGRGLSQAAIAWALDQYGRQGSRRAFIDIGADNVPSLRAAAKAGFHERGRFLIVGVLGVAFTLMPRKLRGVVTG